MQITLTLPDDLAERLRYDAARRSLPPEAVLLRLAEQHLPREIDDARKRAELIEMLRQAREDAVPPTEEEVAEEEEATRQFDAGRSSGRQLFPHLTASPAEPAHR